VKKALILLCSWFSATAFALADGPPVGSGGGGGGYPTTNTSAMNGIKLNGQAKAATGFKTTHAAVRGGKLFIRVADDSSGSSGGSGGPVPVPSPIPTNPLPTDDGGGGTGTGTGGDPTSSNGRALNQTSVTTAQTGWKTRNAAARGGRLFVRK
jgi:hypothetical protein